LQAESLKTNACALQLWHEIRNESARLIQIEWRRYKFETKYEYADDDDPEYEQGIAYLEKLEDRQIRILRELKRQRARIKLVDDLALQAQPPVTVVCGLAPQVQHSQRLESYTCGRLIMPCAVVFIPYRFFL
jgi:hypothetical protein